MGDRCYVCFNVGGLIADEAALTKLFDALRRDNFYYDEGGEPEAFERVIFNCVLGGETLDVDQDEVNYGSIDDTEAAASELGLTWRTDQGAGSGYGSETRYFTPEKGQTAHDDVDGTFYLTSHYIRTLLEKPDAEMRAELEKWVAETNEVQELPPISLGKELFDQLSRKYAPKIAEKALGVEPVAA